MPAIVIAPADALADPAAGMIAATEAELRHLYGGVPRGGVRRLDSTELTPPGGCYLIGRVDGRIVSGGGLRRIDDDVAEIKRMYTVPVSRGQGHAAAMLGALESQARSLGYKVVRLDTGPRQQHARRLYERNGYRSIADYNGNPFASFWGEKQLPG